MSIMQNRSFSLLLGIFLFLGPIVSFSQDCKVLDPNLTGNYTGDCKNGKAEGKGKAVGIHTYEGEFKAGLPDGQGFYTDNLGNSFKGYFKKGKKEGQGLATIKTEKGIDSVLTGFWKRDKYVGLFEAPYKIISKSYMVNSVSVNAEASNNFPTIELTLESVTGGSVDLHGDIPKPTLTEVIFNKGSYNVMNEITTQQKRNVYIFNNLIYPATITFKIGPEEVLIEFYEQKNFKVSIVLRS
ncbi:MAG: hypothetical protein WCH36_00210 [Chitinophagaceae bacterium]